MQIIETNFIFDNLEDRTETKHIIIHHSGSEYDDVQSIHKWHKEGNKWSGIGYHFIIHQDGKVYRGRPQNAKGAHTYLSNSNSIGICVCGNLDMHTMTDAQEISLKELLVTLRRQYDEAMISRHKDHMQTSCPGALFNDKIILEVLAEETKITNVDEALNMLVAKGIINSPDYWKHVANIVNYFNKFILNVANYVK